MLLLCSDGLTSMISEEQISEILGTPDRLDRKADRLIAEANEAGGRDNITVVLFRIEDVGADAPVDAPTMVGERAATSTVPIADLDAPPRPSHDRHRPACDTTAVQDDVDDARRFACRWLGLRAGPPRGQPAGRREDPRAALHQALAALLATLIVLALLGGGGYLATRQLYFIGTNQQGIVTIYRGLPYDLPAGLKLYETFYVSGVPASELPVDRRSTLLNHHLRSQGDAEKLVRSVELGQLAQ